MEILVIIHFRTCCLPVCLKLLQISVYRTVVLLFVLLGYKTWSLIFKDKSLKLCWCCIWCEPNEECILDIVPGGTEL